MTPQVFNTSDFSLVNHAFSPSSIIFFLQNSYLPWFWLIQSWCDIFFRNQVTYKLLTWIWTKNKIKNQTLTFQTLPNTNQTTLFKPISISSSLLFLQTPPTTTISTEQQLTVKPLIQSKASSSAAETPSSSPATTV